MYKILSINPGSTSTKIGVFEDETLKLEKKVVHDKDQFEGLERIMEQKEIRERDIMLFLKEAGENIEDFDAFAARGGILPPLESGTYLVNEEMVDFLENKSKVDHASNLAAVIAFDLATGQNKKAYITDPVSVDEFDSLSRYSGLKDLERISLLHALNMKSVGRKIADEIGKPYDECNFVIAHLGGGISVGAQKNGKMIDVNNANDEGPFSPERSGEMPVGDVVKMAYSGDYTKQNLKRLFTKNSGLKAYLNTNDLLVAYEQAKTDPKALQVIEAMAYQIAKEIGGMCAVLQGKVDCIILTGGLAHSIDFVEMIKGYVSSFGLVAVVPGENELEALATGCLRVLKGEEACRTFSLMEVNSI
ncbi:MAG TPA: butyrate kinase [Thermotogota bacterium]|nr:butyrate kinase [Thermotogota bacterium]HPJ87990.1 butyrate kinase [Thermotogota bacterium]HPR95077.1 butyrate kinase [Thermotogota bacterium]